MSPRPRSRQPVLVTGGAGFIGCNVADRLMGEGEDVLVYDNLARPGVERNLDWLRRRHEGRLAVLLADIRDADALSAAVGRAKAVFHFAAQVAVTSSLSEPREDFAVNLDATFNLLEAARRQNPEVPLVFASTNKVYGDLADVDLVRGGDGGGYFPADAVISARGISEARPLDFHTPYGCSKGAADQYVLDFSRSFGLRTAVLRMSCIYGPRQMGTEDQGWVAHFAKQALAGKPITLYGDGCQVRDILYVDDAVSAYLAAWRHIDRVRGRAFNLGGGPDNAVSLRQLISHIERLLGRRVELRVDEWRAGDQRYYVSDIRSIREALSLPEPLSWREGVERLVRWLARAAGPESIQTAEKAA